MAPFRDNKLCIDDKNSAEVDRSLDAAHLSRHVECLRIESRDSNSTNEPEKSSTNDLPKLTIDEKKGNSDHERQPEKDSFWKGITNLFEGKTLSNWNVLTPEEKQTNDHNRRVFDLADTNHNGMLSYAEMEEALKTPNPEFTNKDKQQLQEQIDEMAPWVKLIDWFHPEVKSEEAECKEFYVNHNRLNRPYW